ncbi:hypothetical protein [Gordonia cholesterolivorans]|uniref:Uncharacterized protein n=1 Tax=Gordonia cholesterolivorans TaxID=559625 RepID=A0ABN3HET7_9ACTN
MTTTEDLYQQANETYVEYARRAALASLERAGLRAVVDLALAARDEMTADGEALAQLVRDVRDRRSHSVTIDGVLIAPCDTYGRVEARHAQETQPWEVLREAAQIYERRWPARTTGGDLRIAADRLEAEHRAEQEKAAAEAEREKLIEQAARAMAAKHNPDIEWDAMSEYTKESFITGARALWDIGWRPAPESDGGEQE